MEKGIVRRLEFPISMGKEALVFKAVDENNTPVALKIYKAETAHFSGRKKYLRGDPRFPRLPQSPFALASLFARKEFRNLRWAERAGVDAPRPLFVTGPIVVMSFVGDEEPYPLLAYQAATASDFKKIMADVRRLYRTGLVHADLSAFNILKGQTPIIIDFSQAVPLAHPYAMDFLKRDVFNILKFFKKQGIL